MPPSRHFHGYAISSIIALDQSARGKSLSYNKKEFFDQSEATNQIRLELFRYDLALRAHTFFLSLQALQ